MQSIAAGADDGDDDVVVVTECYSCALNHKLLKESGKRRRLRPGRLIAVLVPRTALCPGTS